MYSSRVHVILCIPRIKLGEEDKAGGDSTRAVQ